MIIVIDRPYLVNYEALLSKSHVYDYEIRNKDELYFGGALCIEFDFEEKHDYTIALDIKKRLLLN